MKSTFKSKKQYITQSSARVILAGMLMLFFYMQMWGNHEPTFGEGTQLYVVAPSGLTIRHTPHAGSESLGIVPFGSSVFVLTQPDSVARAEKIDWISGQWLYVEYDGVLGYMFDGYLTDLPLPVYEFEKCQLDMDLIYPLESWTDINLGLNGSDTISAGSLSKVTNHYETGDKLVKTLINEDYRVELYLKDIRMMDAYHLLITMLDDKKSVSVFKELSTFIEDNKGLLKDIKIDLDNPVLIRKLKNGDVKIKISTTNPVCGM